MKITFVIWESPPLEEVAQIKMLARQINTALCQLFEKIKIHLVDFKIEVGKSDGKILLADEISPDTCRLWDLTTKRTFG